MSEQEQKPRITDYQPTSKESKMLKKAGLTLQQVLQFSQPTAKQLEIFQKSGWGLVDVILTMNLRTSIQEALNQASIYVIFPSPEEELDGLIDKAQIRAVETVTLFLSHNLYPGKDFSKAQGELALETMKGQVWDSSNLKGCLSQVRNILDPPKPKNRPKLRK